MRNAETVLGIIRERGKRGLPLLDADRQMFNPQLYLLAYRHIYPNNGAMTPGVTDETVDGMSQMKIDRIIEQLRYERFRWNPVSVSTFAKRMVNAARWVCRRGLISLYRRLFGSCWMPTTTRNFGPLHGFRPHRGCHTALQEIRHNWRGTKWFIEGDISQCFDSLTTRS